MAVVATRLTPTAREITVTGELTDLDAARLRTMLVGAILQDGLEHVVVTLGVEGPLDATVVGALIAAADIARERNLRLDVRSSSPATAQRLAEAGLR